jgi:molecular chaperone GrpE
MASTTPPDGPVADADLRAELEEVRERWTRAVADYQNLRRRSAEERAELRMQLLAGLVSGYLGVLDDLDRALGSVDQHEELKEHSWVDGVRLVRQNFAALLTGSGVTEIAAVGEAFDPLRHEAIAYQPGPEGRVMAVVQRGFEAGSQVVRPARVVIGNGEPASNGHADDAGGAAAEGAAPA